MDESAAHVIDRPPSRSAASERKSPPPRSSMEDADSSLTRKRPRLDSGTRSHQNITITSPTPNGKAVDVPAVVSSPLEGAASSSTLTGRRYASTGRIEELPEASNEVTLNLRGFSQTRLHEARDHRSATGAQAAARTSTIPSAAHLDAMPTSRSGSNKNDASVAGSALDSYDGLAASADSGQSGILPSQRPDRDWLAWGKEYLDEFPRLVDAQSWEQEMQGLPDAAVRETDLLERVLAKLSAWIHNYLFETQCIPDRWAGLLASNHEFWHALPCLLLALTDESFLIHTADAVVQSETCSTNLNDFISAFVALTGRLVAVDRITLENSRAELAEPLLFSINYCQCVWKVFQPKVSEERWKALERSGVDLSLQLMTLASTEPAHETLLSGLNAIIPSILARSPLEGGLLKLMRIYWAAPLDLYHLLQWQRSQSAIELKPLERSFSQFFQGTEKSLEAAIKAQSPGLSSELLLRGFVPHLQKFLTKSKSITTMLLARFELTLHQQVGHLNHIDRVFLAEAVWKFDLYEKCIREGRMEIRIAGLDALQTSLIEIYQGYISQKDPEAPCHPIVEVISSRLLQNRLVEYLLSADSHPQIISRSANIVGFLAVSGHWTDGQTDSIWQAMQEMDDFRACENILDMLPSVTKYLEPEDLIHVVRCMQETTLTRIDAKVLSLLLMVCDQLREKSRDLSQALSVSMTAFMVILRKSCTDSTLALSRKLDIWNTIQQGLRNLVAVDWPLSARLAIYRDCFQDLLAGSSGTSGSVAVIGRLLERYGVHDLPRISKEVDVTLAVASDFARLGHLATGAKTGFEEFPAPVEDRLRVLEIIAMQLPGTITSETAARLWTSTVGESAAGARAREAAWGMLARIASNSKCSNPFLDECISTHLPSVDTGFYTRATLAFAHSLCDYERRTQAEPDGVHDSVRSSYTGTELLWRLLLLADDDFISTKAVHALTSLVMEQQKSHKGHHQELALIEKCVTQLIDFSHQIQQIATAHVDEGSCAKLQKRFIRVFGLLAFFATVDRDKDPSSPSTRSESQASQTSLPGERLQVKYITSDLGHASSPHNVDIGSQQTVKELVDRLQTRTGFTKFNVIVGGQRLDTDKYSSHTVSPLLLHKGVILLHRIPGSELLKAGSASTTTRPMDDVIRKQFGNLFNLLSLDAVVADHILQLLRMFPPPDRLFKDVHGQGDEQHHALPLSSPFKASYTLYMFAYRHRTLLEGGTIDYDFMLECVHVMTTALLAMMLPPAPGSDKTVFLLPTELLTTLLSFLKEPVPVQVAAAYFAEPTALVDRLYHLSNIPERNPDNDALSLSQLCFAVLLEVSRLNEVAWKAFSTSARSLAMLRRLVLDCPSPKIRLLTFHSISSVLVTLNCSGLTPMSSDKDCMTGGDSKGSLHASVFVQSFWKMSVKLVPQTAKTPDSRTQQFFQVLLTLFNNLDEQAVDVGDLQTSIREWIQLLFEHQTRQDTLRDTTDWTIKGLGEIVVQGILLLHRKSVDLDLEADFRRRLFDKLLFPLLHDADERFRPLGSGPILAPSTRSILYKLAIRSACEAKELAEFFSLLNEILNDENSLLPSLNFDRSRQLCAPAGYPGLDNLSNTCYLNSLMTQLFMNPRFREFILQCEIVDLESQALLYATQRLFAGLQDGWQRSVNTKELVDAIETYDGPLDPTVQMDADEAFNLLFDRLETQITGPGAKAAFKKLYGGQIVQQIKSKECDHVSERFEPITAIQCDIQGKRNLIQSLQAYIEGETMEGDNKYKCSKCERYVTAVKRACLKDVPDNLIFHLKRFDFDLMSGTRNKVNDYFAFPETVDMAPYTLDYIASGPQSVSTDPFVLVGVLVHNGNAELGHYYSYTRERLGNLDSWVEFNDADVSSFDLATLSDQCYGGMPEDTVNQSFVKSWNAYMLFYQRQSSISADRERFLTEPRSPPMKIAVHPEVASQVAFHNETMARAFCLSAPEHVHFVTDLLSSFVKKRGAVCTQDHILEDEAIECAWAHIEKVFGRETRRFGVGAVLDFFEGIISQCRRCCKTILGRMEESDEMRLRFLLLRLPDPEMRSRIGNLVVEGLRRLKIHSPGFYVAGSDYQESSDVQVGDEQDTTFENSTFATIADQLYSILDFAPLNFKSWPEFYGMLTDLAGIGAAERIHMRRLGFLQHSLEILCIEPRHDWEIRFEGTHTHYLRLVGKRAYNLCNLVKFVVALLEDIEIDADIDMDTGSEMRPPSNDLTQQEKGLLSTTVLPDGGDKRVPWVLERAAVVNEFSFEPRPLEELARWMTKFAAATGDELPIMDLIGCGIVKSPADLAAPYLHIALGFMTATSSPALIEQVLMAAANGTKTIGDSGGAQHLEFFRRCLFLRNEDAFPDQPRQFTIGVLKLCCVWGPPLLEYPDSAVSLNCSHFLQRILFQLPHQLQDDEVSDVVATETNRIWAIISNRVAKFVREKRNLDEHKRAYLGFYEICLAELYPRPEALEENEQSSLGHFKDLLASATDLIAPGDDAASNNLDSDDLTDVSSTYGSPHVVGA